MNWASTALEQLHTTDRPSWTPCFSDTISTRGGGSGFEPILSRGTSHFHSIVQITLAIIARYSISFGASAQQALNILILPARKAVQRSSRARPPRFASGGQRQCLPHAGPIVDAAGRRQLKAPRTGSAAIFAVVMKRKCLSRTNSAHRGPLSDDIEALTACREHAPPCQCIAAKCSPQFRRLKPA